MRDRGRGAIIIVASGVGLTSAPYTAAYAANKAFQITLGEALWYELRGSGVDVLVMIGGLMNTQGDALAKYPHWMIAEPAPVVREVLSAVGRKPMVIPGFPQSRLLVRADPVDVATAGDLVNRPLHGVRAWQGRLAANRFEAFE
jgi:short-subunit dehydrogenase